MLSASEQHLARLIESRRQFLLDDLRLHVALPTGHNNTPALDESRERLTARCRALGATVELIPGDPRPEWLQSADSGPTTIPPFAICRRLNSSSSPDSAILIAGHLDTVHDPRGPFRELTTAPDHKTALGPGCVDMKGGLVVAIAALEALAEAGIDVSWSFLLNSDEETGSFHSDRALRAEAARPDYLAAIALEPAMADGGLAIQRGGSGQFILEATGKAAHVGRDFASGRSAVDALAQGILHAHALSDVSRGVCVNISPLWCPNPANMVADRARAWGNARFPSAEAGSLLERALRALPTSVRPPADAARAGGWAPGELRVQTAFTRPAKPLTSQVQLLADAARAAAADLAQPLPFGKTAGVCDGNNLQDAGLPTLDTLGVRGGGLHTPQEWIELSSLVERCQLLAVFLSRLVSGQAPMARK
ncbi:MAG: M20/M25/M40 family metallo-hydrolase [Phycisphaerales bacterium]